MTDERTIERISRQAVLVWAALLLGQVAFLAVVLFLTQGGEWEPTVDPGPPLPVLVWVVTVASLAMGLTIRGAVFRKRTTEENGLSPRGWLSGNVIAWAMAEGAVLPGPRLLPPDRQLRDLPPPCGDRVRGAAGALPVDDGAPALTACPSPAS